MFDFFSLEFLHSLNPYLATFVISMLPIGELRASIPIGIGFYNLSAAEAVFISLMGDIIVASFLLFFLSYITKTLAGKSKKIDKMFSWIFERTRNNFFEIIIV